MTEVEVLVSNRLGLHARAAARFVHLACRFQSRITVIKDGTSANGKSILGLLTLAACQGSRLKLTADGSDEGAAVEELVQLVQSRFREES